MDVKKLIFAKLVKSRNKSSVVLYQLNLSAI